MKRAPTAPPELAGFRYLRHLGGGGFADVFEYVDTLGRHVAVKVLLSGLGRDRQRAFEDEARRMAQLSNHPSIVSIYQAGAAPDGRPFLVMEYCPPPELWQRVRERPVSLAKTLEIGVQVAGAVESAHRLDILHRDIKPANILFTEFGHPALTDFGIAASTLAGQSGEAEGLSVPWAPPEQLTAGSPMGASGDVYALAATLWTCLAGHHPFYRAGGPNDTFHLSARIKRDPVPRTGREDVPESLERALAIAMDKRPEARYRTAREFALALQGIQAELHLPITANDIRASTVPADVVREEDDGHTRIRAIVAIDPEGFLAPPTATHGRAQAPAPSDVTAPGGIEGGGTTATEASPAATTPVDTDQRVVTDHGPHTRPEVSTDHTMLHERPAPAADTGVAPAEGSQARQGSDPPVGSGIGRRLALLGAVLAVAAGGLAVAHFAGSGAASSPENRATTSARPADPLEGVVPAPKGRLTRGAGTQVVLVLENPAPQAGDSYYYRLVDPASPQPYSTTDQRTVTLSAPAGRACVEVMLRRSSGRSSTPVGVCTGG
ncbi:MAG: protein kinase [Austwickia sp.]|nr:protein kinase [Austwickia sp.]MCO5307692.1 protein kinase [Austwickia sp.]